MDNLPEVHFNPLTDNEMMNQLKDLALMWKDRTHLEDIDMFINRDLVFSLVRHMMPCLTKENDGTL